MSEVIGLGEWTEEMEGSEPQIWYHGTNRQFNEFKHPSELKGVRNFGFSHDNQGIFFSKSEQMVRQYADPLGVEYAEHTVWLNNTFGGETYIDGIKNWNSLMNRLVEQDKNIYIERELGRLSLADFDEANKEGKVEYSQSMQMDGKPICWIGELLRLIGGDLPRQTDRWVPYKSVYQKVEDKLAKFRQHEIVQCMPIRAMPRIIPVILDMDNPVIVSVSGDLMDLDGGFHEGISICNDDPSHDGVVVEPKNSTIFSQSAVVFDPKMITIVTPSNQMGRKTKK